MSLNLDLLNEFACKLADTLRFKVDITQIDTASIKGETFTTYDDLGSSLGRVNEWSSSELIDFIDAYVGLAK